MKSHRRIPATLVVALTLLLAACSGGPGATAGPTGSATAQPGGPGTGASAGAPGSTLPPGEPGATSPTSGGNGSPAPGVTDVACTMLAAADILSVVNATLVTAVPAQQQGIFTNGCLFELKDNATSATTTVNLGAMVTGGRAYWDTEIAPTMTQNGYTPIQGLGDAAINARAGSVMALAGDSLIYVQYFGPAGPDQAVATEVVRRVLANLGF